MAAYKDSEGSNFNPWNFIFPKAGGGDASVYKLQRQLEDMQQWMRNSSERQTVIVHSSNDKGRSGTIITGIIITVVGGLVYIRFIKGWRLSDLYLVTQGSLQAMKASMQEGLNAVSEQVKHITREALERFHLVDEKQDQLMQQQRDLMDKQDKMDENLDEVGGNVGRIQNSLDEVKFAIGQVQQMTQLVGAALVEVAKKAGVGNGQQTRSLEAFMRTNTFRTIQPASTAQGLEGLAMLTSGETSPRALEGVAFGAGRLSYDNLELTGAPLGDSSASSSSFRQQSRGPNSQAGARSQTSEGSLFGGSRRSRNIFGRE